MKKGIEKMKRKLIMQKGKEEEREKRRMNSTREKRMEQRIKEKREREERKRNIMIEIKMNNRDLREGIGKVMKDIGIEVGIEREKVRRVNAVQKGGEGMAVVTLENLVQKREMMEKRED